MRNTVSPLPSLGQGGVYHLTRTYRKLELGKSLKTKIFFFLMFGFF